jgi:hypothetical protein
MMFPMRQPMPFAREYKAKPGLSFDDVRTPTSST